MTVVEFETWRAWIRSSNKRSEEIWAWFELPVEAANEIRESLGMRQWWIEGMRAFKGTTK